MSRIDETRESGESARVGPGPWPGPGVILAALVIVAAALRFWKLGYWNFEATEMFTLRDSIRPQFLNPRPLGYLLNYYLVRPFHPLDEFGLRLVPAVAGVLAIPVLYAVARRLVGTRAALLSALLLTVSALHVFYAQFARYWSLVFLFSAVYPYALYLGVRQRSRRLFTLGCGALVLAVLAHPVSAILLGGPVIWLLATYLRPHYLKRAWTHPSFRWGLLIAVILGAALTARLVPLLRDWVTMHDQNPGMGQFLLGPKLPQGAKQMVILLGYLESLTLPVALAAAAGLYLLCRERDRTLGLFLASLALFHPALVALVSLRTPVSQFYLLPAAPVFYLGAGVFLERIFEVDWKLRPRWLMPVTLTLALLAAGAPTLVSQYRNGRRFDFRGVAHWLEPRRSPRDVIFSDQPMVLAHYLGGAEVRKLRHDPAPLAQSADELRRSDGEAALWIVAPAPAHAFRTNLKAGGLASWLHENCQLRNTVGRGRLDFRQQYLQVFRCPPMAGPLSDAATPPGPADR
jgi:4-amino-4-deoxy-L-arabinose transferase-like glycosyltransferase